MAFKMYFFHKTDFSKKRAPLGPQHNFGLSEPPKTGQDRPKTGPRSSREALENKLFPCYFLDSILVPSGVVFGVPLGCLWGLFWRPLALKIGAKIGAKFDQKIVDNKNRPKMTPRDEEAPQGPPQGRPRTPQGRPRTPREHPGSPQVGQILRIPLRKRWFFINCWFHSTISLKVGSFEAVRLRCAVLEEFVVSVISFFYKSCVSLGVLPEF